MPNTIRETPSTTMPTVTSPPSTSAIQAPGHHGAASASVDVPTSWKPSTRAAMSAVRVTESDVRSAREGSVSVNVHSTASTSSAVQTVAPPIPRPTRRPSAGPCATPVRRATGTAMPTTISATYVPMPISRAR